jgi:hypothetical protein
MGNPTLRHETTIETAKALPAVAGATIAGLTLNEVVAAVTILYILLQSAYLLWKWRKEAQKGK